MAAQDRQTDEQTDVPTVEEFEAFDSFPWLKHKAFLLGLIETLGGVDNLSPNPTHQGSTTFCRTVFYRRQTTRPVDLVRYNAFLAAHPDYPSVDRRLLTAIYAAKTAITSAETIPSSTPSQNLSRRIVDIVALSASATNTPSVPSWQSSAPKNELRVPRPLPTADSNGEAPYSDKFAKVIEAVQTGKELEGVRHIPDTVVRKEGITPLGKRKAPKKPWEKAASTPETQPAIDLQFPEPQAETDKPDTE